MVFAFNLKFKDSERFNGGLLIPNVRGDLYQIEAMQLMHTTYLNARYLLWVIERLIELNFNYNFNLLKSFGSNFNLLKSFFSSYGSLFI